jgi:sugar phosphate isomerase/epimerase
MNPITFSSLACPHWHIDQVIARACEFDYDGIEWRGGMQGHVQPGMLASAKRRLRQQCSEAGLIVLAVTTYTTFVSASPAEREANLDELQRYVDLATEVGAAYVRTFVGELPEGTKPTPTIYEHIVDCLHAASEYADSVGVKIAVEPHDDFVHSSTVIPILSRLSLPSLQVIWDLGNTFAVGEEPTEGMDLLNDRIGYVHVKDGKGRATNWQLCALGKGDVPLENAFELLLAKDFQGAFSVEWEYAWHPELDPPEIALPAALQVVRRLLDTVQHERT